MPLVLEIDPRLAEEAVHLVYSSQGAAPYWQEREAIYSQPDVEAREHDFQRFHTRVFEVLDLAGPIRQALAAEPLVTASIEVLRVTRAITARDEGAELYVSRDQPAAGSAARRGVLLRLRPLTLLEPERLQVLLRHELLHIADMLDPRFGYDPDPPELKVEPARASAMLDRYRVLWDTAIDGRLSRQGCSWPGARDLRRREIARAFALEDRQAEAVCQRWFDATGLSHREIVAAACGRV